MTKIRCQDRQLCKPTPLKVRIIAASQAARAELKNSFIYRAKALVV